MNKFYKYKFIPQNYLAEEVLLGIVLIYPRIINKTKQLINEKVFFIEIHKKIFSKLIKKIDNTDNNMIRFLSEIGDRLGGINHMIELMKKSQVFISCCETNNYLEKLIKLLKKIYIKRLIIQLGYNIIGLGYINNIENYYLYTKILSYINNISKELEQGTNNDVTTIKQFISQKLLGIKYFNIENKLIETEKKITSGLLNLDTIIKNFPKGNLIIIAGRPSIGKTSLSINIAYHCFFTENINLLVFSLEMTSEQIFNKFMTIGSKINIEKQSIETVNNKNWEKISKICNKLLKQNIYVNEKPKLNIDQIEFIARNLKKNQFIELLIIDYLQLIDSSNKNNVTSNRSQEISHITRRLKLLAQYLKIPIIVISQLNRNIEVRQNKEPLLSDLKESGCIIYNKNIDYKEIEQQKDNPRKNIAALKTQFMYHSKKISKDIMNRISILNKKTFKYFIKKVNSELTYNHKCLYKNTWVKSSHILLTTNITLSFLSNEIEPIKLKRYSNKIKFNKCSKTYDIKINNYFNFLIQSIITHNSIEQDADIIIILYEIDNEKYNTKLTSNKIIDLKISKNRNGRTGYCKLNFEPYNNMFRDVL
uniref:DNA 5'-3' helicase n=1 Tax=Polysiphonia infestans TaxID=2006978 RepID=A0A1Z1MEN2_9FLOR|nr:Replication helicase subunit [Polysiphonia infestans]ARW64443.1 Replication helicase subunit [Polysiphonia infestans]